MAKKSAVPKAKKHGPSKSIAGGKVSRGGIRRLARRAGVKRLARGTYDETNTAIKQFIELVMQHVAAIMDLKRTKTVSTGDVLYALKTMGNAIYV